jgi:filamentous hemagglutinin
MVVRASDLSDREREPFARLRVKATEIRRQYIANKKISSGNVAVLEYVSPGLEEPITVEATSRAKSPSPKPLPRSMGGYFEPSTDPSCDRDTPMDTDAEYKALSELARRIDAMASSQRTGVVYLFTERQPCASCASVLAQFEERFPLVSIVVEFDYPFPQ